jgi:hypothetical protein
MGFCCPDGLDLSTCTVETGGRLPGDFSTPGVIALQTSASPSLTIYPNVSLSSASPTHTYATREPVIPDLVASADAGNQRILVNALVAFILSLSIVADPVAIPYSL